MMVVNKKIKTDSPKGKEVYDILHKIILEGCGLPSALEKEDDEFD
jgi:hypothetical protein